jgi:hypothetical protein
MTERAWPVTGRVHQIIVIAQDIPGTFEVRCVACHRREPHGRCDATCHTTTWTPWGEDHALEIGELHLYYMAHPNVPRFHELPGRRHGLKR